MEILKMECPTCKGEKEILKIVRESEPNVQTVTYFFSCGHKQVKQEVTEFIRILDFIEVKHRDAQRILLSKYKTKISGKTKRPVRETITIDHEGGRHHHVVEEQQDDGEWEIVHEH